jgi:hypothetical protein
VLCVCAKARDFRCDGKRRVDLRVMFEFYFATIMIVTELSAPRLFTENSPAEYFMLNVSE